MSAYIVEDETINRIVSYLDHDRDGEWMRRKVAGVLGVARFDVLALASAMFALNVEAVECRYGDSATYGTGEGSFRPLDFAYSYESANVFQVIKSLKCWLYQCSEGDIPEQSALFRVLEQYAGELACGIVSDMPQYEAASWG